MRRKFDYAYVMNNPLILTDPTGMSADTMPSMKEMGNAILTGFIESNKEVDRGIMSLFSWEEGSGGSQSGGTVYTSKNGKSIGVTNSEETPDAMTNVDDFLSLSGGFNPGNKGEMIGRAFDSEVAILEWLGLSAYIVNKVAKGKKHRENVVNTVDDILNADERFEVTEIKLNDKGDTMYIHEKPIKIE